MGWAVAADVADAVAPTIVTRVQVVPDEITTRPRPLTAVAVTAHP